MTRQFIIVCRNCDSTDVDIEPVYGGEIKGIEIVTDVKLICKSCGYDEYISVSSQDQI
ncbi:MAG: hypothetical protein H3Z50_07440 [archaeon]|nr:hypothetical protein [archaeon]MCP8306735.1 hypothetical protein [archaeon]